MKSPVARIWPLKPSLVRSMRAQEKPRPSANFGNSMTTTERRCTSSPSSSGDSSGFRRTPMGVLRSSSEARSFRKRVSETIAPPASGSIASSATVVNVSAANASPVISGIQLFLISDVLERLHADAAIGVEEAFAVLAGCEIIADDAFDRRTDLVDRKARSHDVADAGVFGAGAAKLELVEFDALLVDAQDADMAGVMMAAGIDAAGYLDLEFADLMLAIELLEALRNILRNRDRARVGKIAIVET